LEPLHATYYTYLAQNFIYDERWDEAEAMLRKALELQPSASGPHGLLFLIALLRGNTDAALRETQLAPPGPGRDYLSAFLRGEREEADQALQQSIAKFGEQNPYGIAWIYAVRREPEKMFEWLDRAYQRRQPPLLSNLVGNPVFKPYYSEPRFVALCKKIGMAVPK
jgi:serine/threonine-protein kinase